MMSEEDGAQRTILKKPAISAENQAEDSLEEEEEEALVVSQGDCHSSSTEGPDSQAHSTTSSPIHIMIPAYPAENPGDYGLEDDEDKPLLPLFAVKFSEEANKDGDVVKYKIRVKKLLASAEQDQSVTIEREYDDFEYLHHVLTTHNQIIGLIVPPLPPRPLIDPSATEKQSKRQFGSNARAMLGDDFKKDAHNLERYMQQMLSHPIFGRDKHLDEFLMHATAPIRAKIKKGFLANMRESLDLRKTSGVRDPDDFFQKEREWATAYCINIKDTCDKFNGVIYSQTRLANQITHLATLLNASVGGHEGTNAFYNRLNSRFSTSLEESEKKGLIATVDNEENTLSPYLSQWTAFMDAENAMLHRRATLVIEADNATKALAKAKPTKAHAARKAREDKEKQLEQVSKIAELEVRRFHHQRLAELKSSLLSYAEGQLKVALETHKALSDCTLKMRDFPLPRVTERSLSRPE